MNGLKVFQVKVCLLRLEFFLVGSWFCFNSPCDWSRKLMPPFQPIRGNTETNWGLVARVFPRLRWFVFYHKFSLVPCDICVCFDWPLRLPILLFLVSNYKLTLGPAESELTLMLCNLLVQWLPSDKNVMVEVCPFSNLLLDSPKVLGGRLWWRLASSSQTCRLQEWEKCLHFGWIQHTGIKLPGKDEHTSGKWRGTPGFWFLSFFLFFFLQRSTFLNPHVIL